MSFNGSLALWLHKRSNPLSFQEIISIVHKTADALHQLHNQQKIHQDINPSNILLYIYDEEGNERINLQLADRGTIVHTSTHSNKNFHVNSQLMYMAPEQWNGNVVPATDQYALAVMTYELLTGRPPFQGSPAQLMDLHIKTQPAAPSTLNPRVPPAVDSVVLNALAKRPEDRFLSVSDFTHALEQALQRPESLLANAIPAGNMLCATLLISKIEAEKGIQRTITLSSGRHITVSAPKGAYDGQIILTPMGTAGVLLLTIAVSQAGKGISAYGLMKLKNLKQKVIVLVSLVVLIILVGGIVGGTGLFSRLTSRVSIPYPPFIGSLAIDDALHDNTGGYNWPDGINSDGGTCQFIQGAYHAIMTHAAAFHYCVAGDTKFDNFAYEVHMTIVKGDEGGIIFRSDGPKSKFYYFRVGRDASYDLYLYIDTLGAHAKRLADGITPAIHTGLNHPNLLAVVARNDILDLYVNNQNITRVSTNAYSSGQIGVAATFDTDPTEVAFSNVKVWKL